MLKLINFSYKRGNNLSGLSAINDEKLLGYMIFKGSVKSSDFGGFLLCLLKNYPIIINSLNKSIFCLDNAAIHKAKILIEL